MKNLTIIDCGSGNLASVTAVFAHLGCETFVASHADALKDNLATLQCIIVPGVGNGSYMMKELQKRNFVPLLAQWVRDDKPLLGICVGAQVLLSVTHEGNSPCLALIPGECRSFATHSAFQQGDACTYKIPHMGWNEVIPSDEHASHPLFDGIPRNASFYFVNSYYLHPTEKKHALAYTDYGISFASIIGVGTAIGLQFHPEKSGEQGIALLRNFLVYSAGLR